MNIQNKPSPDFVTLPDGTQMTRQDLPPADTKRWVISRKAAIVRAVEAGLITPQEALSTYGLSQEELEGWQQTIKRHGLSALKATSVQKLRT